MFVGLLQSVVMLYVDCGDDVVSNVALDMSKAFDIINIHTLIGKLLQPSSVNILCK